MIPQFSQNHTASSSRRFAVPVAGWSRAIGAVLALGTIFVRQRGQGGAFGDGLVSTRLRIAVKLIGEVLRRGAGRVLLRRSI